MPQPPHDISDLLKIMARLRAKDGGCPWDREQTFASIAPYTIEEAYEAADAIARGAYADLCDELGDLLLQVVFQAQIASERGLFAFGDVVESICAKMIRRHPHIFGDVFAIGKARLRPTSPGPGSRSKPKNGASAPGRRRRRIFSTASPSPCPRSPAP